jgi:hypothetical protein
LIDGPIGNLPIVAGLELDYGRLPIGNIFGPPGLYIILMAYYGVKGVTQPERCLPKVGSLSGQASAKPEAAATLAAAT